MGRYHFVDVLNNRCMVSHPLVMFVNQKPEKVIAEFIQKNDIDLLVMGTVARSGLSGIIVGNTAEKILNHVDCSVLTLKPGGWKSPIK